MPKSPNYIKPTIAFSVIAGLVLGIVLLIPYLGIFSVFLFLIIGGAIVFILKRANFIGIFSQKEGVAIGTISGVVSVCAAAVVFIPIYLIINFIFHLKGMYSFFATSISTSIYDLIVVIMMVIFLGFINALFNIGSALTAIYIINTYIEKEKPSEEIGEFKIDV